MTAVPVAAACVDSVLLMRLARDLTRESGIEDAAAMGRWTSEARASSDTPRVWVGPPTNSTSTLLTMSGVTAATRRTVTSNRGRSPSSMPLATVRVFPYTDS